MSPVSAGIISRALSSLTPKYLSLIHIYIAPYARRLYYGTHFNFDRTGHHNAGPLWLERMKIDHRKDLLRGVAAIVGGKAHGG